MHDGIASLLARSERIIALPDGSAWRLRRVDTLAMIEHGAAELVGAGAADAALQEARQAFEAALRGQDPTEASEGRQRALQATLEALGERVRREPQLAVTLGRRADAYACASVRSVGVSRAEDAGPIEPAMYDELGPIRLVMDEAAEDHDADPPRMHVARLAEASRTALGWAAMALSTPTAEVRPFRRPAGTAGTDRRNGAEVRGATD